MTDTTIVAVPASPTSSYLDWGAIIGGAFVASALSFILFAFGASAGIASVSPYSWNNPSVTTLSLIAVAWFVIVMIGSFLVGGYFAGRMRQPSGLSGASEREMRDGAHGLIVWALGLVIGAWIATMAAGATARTAAVASGGAVGAAMATSQGDRTAGIVDTMLRPAAGSQARGDDPRAEVTRILASASVRGGTISDADRTYLAQVIAARTGVPEDEARRRVDAGIEQAKSAADTARKAAAVLAFLIGAASLFAAGAAFWGAREGGRHRDEAILSNV